MNFVLSILAVVIICLVVLVGYISFLAHKERRELNNRLMCKSVDEFLKIEEKGGKPEGKDKPLSQHQKLVNGFKSKGVNDG